MKNQSDLHTRKLERLRRDIREGLPAHPWNVNEIKSQGRKRLATRKASK